MLVQWARIAEQNAVQKADTHSPCTAPYMQSLVLSPHQPGWLELVYWALEMSCTWCLSVQPCKI